MNIASRPAYLAFRRTACIDPGSDAMTRVLRRGWVGAGEETIAFECERKDLVDAPLHPMPVDPTVAVSSRPATEMLTVAGPVQAAL